MNTQQTITIFRALLISIILTIGGITQAKAYKVFDPPRIQDRDVDRCIHSWQYPDGCSKAATRHAAGKFCKTKGYSCASYWSWKDYPHNDGATQWNVVKLIEEGNPVRSYFQNARGSWVFQVIVCE